MKIIKNQKELKGLSPIIAWNIAKIDGRSLRKYKIPSTDTLPNKKDFALVKHKLLLKLENNK